MLSDQILLISDSDSSLPHLNKRCFKNIGQLLNVFKKLKITKNDFEKNDGVFRLDIIVLSENQRCPELKLKIIKIKSSQL